ncbi:enoyl-CoA hydratase/isomerase family protein [Sphingomonas bacterium]|uniref:enoyl-CoA hydratase/isomerase family protein n=1 Tax=Sphingomonas bacterium TaxID=1895847 RepID=UPI0015757365|nr:enoyl-CoA hydratase/isomerase family protein [Sphingomonas bacterium]
MDDPALLPWMLRSDWRADRRPLVTVDLAQWPADEAIDPLPPVPVIAIGSADHPQAGGADVVIEPPIPLAAIVAGIAAAPRAASALVELLRSIEELAPAAALTLESFAFAMAQGSAEHAGWLARRPPPRAAAPGRLLIERKGATLALTIDRAAARNMIDRAMRDALHDAFTIAALDPAIERVTLRGSGRCFSMGADLAEFGTTRDPAEAHAIRARTLPARAMLPSTAICHVHVQGGCVGAGLELAAFAGRISATRNAWFQLPELEMGILPGAGGCVSVPARIGRQRAAALMLSGKRIGADVALRWGLIDAIVDDLPADDRGAHEIGGE